MREADPRHAQLIRKSFGVTGRSISTAGVKDRLDDIEGETRLRRRRRIDVVRIRCVRGISQVTGLRYKLNAEIWLASCNSRQTWMKWAEEIGPLSRGASEAGLVVQVAKKSVTRKGSWCGTDRAGCLPTKKSVSGCALMLGSSTVCTCCKGQAVIALSSGEAKYYGLVSVTSQMLGIQSILQTGDGNLKPTCGWMPKQELRLGASDGSDGLNTSTQCFSGYGRRSRRARSRLERILPEGCLRAF